MNIDGEIRAERLVRVARGVLPRVAVLPAIAFFLAPIAQVLQCVSTRFYAWPSWLFYRDYVVGVARPIAVSAAIVTIVAVVLVSWLAKTSERLASFRSIWPFVLLAALEVVATLANPDNAYRFDGIEMSCMGLWSYLVLVGAYLLPSTQVSSRVWRRRLAMLFCVTSVVCAVYALWKFYVIGQAPSNKWEYSAYLDSIFYQFNHYGYFLALAIPLSASMFAVERRRSYRLFFLTAYLLNTIILQLNNTMGAWLACMMMLCALPLAWRLARGRWNACAIAAPVIFIGTLVCVGLFDARMVDSVLDAWHDLSVLANALVAPRTAEAAEAIAGSVDAEVLQAGTNRVLLWITMTGYVLERPLLGWGAEGCWQALKAATDVARPHCEPLLYACDFGIPAAVAYCLGCCSVYAKSFKARTRLDGTSAACLMAAGGYLISSLFGDTFFYTTPYLHIFLGLGVAGLVGGDERG